MSIDWAGARVLDLGTWRSTARTRPRTGLIPGTYFAWAYAWQPYSSYKTELFEEIPCPDATCDPLSGTPIVVTEPAVIEGIDFTLPYAPFFSDGFESGDTTAWTSVVP